MAMMVLLFDAAGRDVNLGDRVASGLAKLGVTNVSLLRDPTTVGIVLEGWLFDPACSADAAAAVIGADSGLRSLQPIIHMAVESAAKGG